jgi:hypothetical protein
MQDDRKLCRGFESGWTSVVVVVVVVVVVMMMMMMMATTPNDPVY